MPGNIFDLIGANQLPLITFKHLIIKLQPYYMNTFPTLFILPFLSLLLAVVVHQQTMYFTFMFKFYSFS